jgi:hypothetical protein
LFGNTATMSSVVQLQDGDPYVASLQACASIAIVAANS